MIMSKWRALFSQRLRGTMAWDTEETERGMGESQVGIHIDSFLRVPSRSYVVHCILSASFFLCLSSSLSRSLFFSLFFTLFLPFFLFFLCFLLSYIFPFSFPYSSFPAEPVRQSSLLQTYETNNVTK